MTDEEIITGMQRQAKFTDSLMEQIGDVRGSKVDHGAGLIHFYGTHKNCSFNLAQVVGDLEAVALKVKEFKGLSFT